jgi:hypothetical protein
MSKKVIMHYSFIDILNKDYSIQDYLESTSPSRSCWFSNMPVNISKFVIGKYIPSIRKFIHHCHTEYFKGDPNILDMMDNTSLATVRTCPGVRGILEGALLVKSPCDVSITINDLGGWACKVAAPSLISVIEGHGPEQFQVLDGPECSKILNGKRIVKFCLPINLDPLGNTYIHLDPVFHSKIPLKVVPGVIKEDTPLNIITVFEIPRYGETLEVDIKKGDVIAYLWAEKGFELKEVKLLRSKVSSTFLTQGLGGSK